MDGGSAGPGGNNARSEKEQSRRIVMSRINTNVSSLYAQQGLARSQASLNTTLQRLSTGLRINSGADDPSGLIASQQLKAEMAGITQAVSNSQRANNVIATAEGALNEVSNLL